MREAKRIFMLACVMYMLCAGTVAAVAADGTTAVNVRYTTVAMDGDDGTTFAEGTLPFALQDFAPPAGLVGVSAVQAVRSLVFTTLAGHWDGDWHPAPQRQYAILLRGAVDIEVTTGMVQRFNAGDVILLEDTAGRGHDTRVIGPEPAIFAIVVLPE